MAGDCAGSSSEVEWSRNGNSACGLRAHLGDARKAIEYYEQQLTIARELGDRRGEGIALFNMSLAQDSLGKRMDANRMATEALNIFKLIESPYAERVRQKLETWQK